MIYNNETRHLLRNHQFLITLHLLHWHADYITQQAATQLCFITRSMNTWNTLTDWFRANQLSVNANKTEYLRLTKHKDHSNDDIHLQIDNVNLEKVTHTKCLGLDLDGILLWEHHINSYKKKISHGMYAMNAVKHVLGNQHLKTLYYSLVHPYLLYGNLIWENACQTDLHKLEICLLQKRCH